MAGSMLSRFHKLSSAKSARKLVALVLAFGVLTLVPESAWAEKKALLGAAGSGSGEMGPVPGLIEDGLGGVADDEGEGSGTVAGPIAPGTYFLASSFQCNQSQPFCQTVNAVLRYTYNGPSSTATYSGVHISGIPGPYGMAIHPVRRTLLVASRATGTIREYNLNSGAFLGNFVVAGPEGLHLPQNIIFTPSGNLLVTSFQSELNYDKFNGILEFNGTTGQFVRAFVDGGFILSDDCIRPPGQPTAPCLRGAGGMVYGPNGNLFVASNLNDAIIEYHGTTGAYVGVFDSSKLISPNGVLVRQAGTLREGNVLASSRYRATASETDKWVEFDKNTRELTNAVSGGVLLTGIENPGPGIFETATQLLISDRLFWNVPPNYSDRVRRHNANTGAFSNFLLPTSAPFPLHYLTGMLMVNIGCTTNTDCNDGNPCTIDVCTSGLCSNTPDDSINPNDGLFCNGVEDRCQNGQVVYAVQPPNCNDNLACTQDRCDETLDQCVNALLPDKCLIAGVCRDFGTVDPSTGCRECNPVVNATNWTNSPSGTPCGDQNNSDCDAPNTCNGAGVCLDNFEPINTPCGNDASNACTAPDSCNGTGLCRANNSPDNTVCNDSNPCTLTDRCQSGVCVGTGTPCTNPQLPACFNNNGVAQCVQCNVDTDCFDDPNRCTSVTCSTDLRQCIEFANDANCPDPLFCDGIRRCNGTTGLCENGPPPCNPGQFCDEANDRCVGCLQDADCNDGLFCNGTERCVSQVCQPGTAVNCSQFNGQCTVGVCNEALARCVSQPSNEGGTCTDGNACTVVDRCVSGTCVGSGSPNCDDGNPCTDDSCANGQCTYVNNTEPCDDGNPCTQGDTCSAGSCVGGTPIVCDDGNPCTVDSCHPVLGCRITNVPSSPPTACDDGSACTTNDFCFGGICVGGQNVDCSDNNPCTTDTCDAVLGCRYSHNTLACDDGNDCTVGDACSGGVCVAGTPINCNDGNPCTTDACVNGTCVSTNNTNPCNDNNPCTENDRCGNGVCAGTPRNCPEGTSCNPATGVCKACLNNSECNDNNPCTNDVCNNGNCVHTNNNSVCNDGLNCTINDTCSNGACVGTPMNCPTGLRCDPGDGICKQCFNNGECNDGNVCTQDICNNGTCQHPPQSGPCNDGNLCTENDTCSGGVCSGTAVQCTSPETCDPADGECKECRTSADCNDNNGCTDDHCDFGVCEHTSNAGRCNDNNPCTANLCNPVTGQCSNPVTCVYGDVAPIQQGNCAVDVNDVTCALDGFRRPALCPRADVFPCGGDGTIGFGDILAIIEAFKGVPPCPPPGTCP